MNKIVSRHNIQVILACINYYCIHVCTLASYSSSTDEIESFSNHHHHRCRVVSRQSSVFSKASSLISEMRCVVCILLNSMHTRVQLYMIMYYPPKF